jgi:hypothetical protein
LVTGSLTALLAAGTDADLSGCDWRLNATDDVSAAGVCSTVPEFTALAVSTPSAHPGAATHSKALSDILEVVLAAACPGKVARELRIGRCAGRKLLQ